MQWYQLQIKAQTAFATPLKGDTMFGQLCWTLREQFGNSELEHLLTGYNKGTPFVVISDPMPKGAIKKPCAPPHLLGFDKLTHSGRKQVKNLEWVSTELLTKPLAQWHSSILLSARNRQKETYSELRYHNTINRLTEHNQ